MKVQQHSIRDFNCVEEKLYEKSTAETFVSHLKSIKNRTQIIPERVCTIRMLFASCYLHKA